MASDPDRPTRYSPFLDRYFALFLGIAFLPFAAADIWNQETASQRMDQARQSLLVWIGGFVAGLKLSALTARSDEKIMRNPGQHYNLIPLASAVGLLWIAVLAFLPESVGNLVLAGVSGSAIAVGSLALKRHRRYDNEVG